MLPNNYNMTLRQPPGRQFLTRSIVKLLRGSFIFRVAEPWNDFVYPTFQSIMAAAENHAAHSGLRIVGRYECCQDLCRVELLLEPIPTNNVPRQPFIFNVNAPAFVPRAQPGVVMSIEEVVDTEQSDDERGDVVAEHSVGGTMSIQEPDDVEATEAEKDVSEEGAEEVKREADGRYYPDPSLDSCAYRLAELDLTTISKDCRSAIMPEAPSAPVKLDDSSTSKDLEATSYNEISLSSSEAETVVENVPTAPDDQESVMLETRPNPTKIVDSTIGNDAKFENICIDSSQPASDTESVVGDVPSTSDMQGPSTSDLQGPSSGVQQHVVQRSKAEKRKDKKDKKKARKERKRNAVVEKEEIVEMPKEKELMNIEDLKIKRLEKCSSETTFCKNHQGHIQIVKISVTVKNSNSWKTAKLCRECINKRDCSIGSRWPEEVWTLLMEVKHVYYHGDFTKYSEEEIDEFLNKEVIWIPLANPEFYKKVLSRSNSFLLSEINWFQYKKTFKECDCKGPVNIRIVGLKGPGNYTDWWTCDRCAIEMITRPDGERLHLPILVWESLDIAKLMKMHQINLIDRVQAFKLCMNEALHFIDNQSRAKIYETFRLFLHSPIDLTVYDLNEGDDVYRMERKLAYDTDRLKWDITSRFVTDDAAKGILIKFMKELRAHEQANKMLEVALKNVIDTWKYEHKLLVVYSVVNPEYRANFFKYAYALLEKSGLSQESLPEFSSFILF